MVLSTHIARLIAPSDHCIEQFGQCSTTLEDKTGQVARQNIYDHCILPSDLSGFPLQNGGSLQEAYTRQLHSNDLINGIASSPGCQTADQRYNGCLHVDLPWKSNRTIEDTRCAEGAAVEQCPNTPDPEDLSGFDTNALFGNMNVLFDTALSGYHSVDECFDYGLSTMSNSVSPCSFAPTIRHTADEASAYNSQSSFCSNYAISDVQSPLLFHSIDAFHATDKAIVYPQSTPSETSSASKVRSSRRSSSSQSTEDTLEDIPVGKMRIDKQPTFRRRHVQPSKSFKCATCAKVFKHEKDLVRHEARSCGGQDRQNKPFLCTCDLRYKRKDDLQRHIKKLNSHENSDRHKIKDQASTSSPL